MSTGRGRGRRPGNGDSRDAILAAARAEFEKNGYDGATMRAIAARADVDPALIHHFFGSKGELFLAAVDLELDPDVISARIADGPRTELGQRAVRTFLGVWGDPRLRQPLLGMLRSAMTHEIAATMLRQFITHVLLPRLAAALDGVPDAELRAEAIASHLVGMGVLRYVVKVEPMASATEDELVDLIGPVLQQYVPDE